MIRHVIVGVCAVASLGMVSAQDTFTARLQRREAGQGVVVLHHDAEIDALVNGLVPDFSPTTTRQDTDADTQPIALPQLPGGAEDSSSIPGGKKVRINGYRVQVYVGGNSRDAKYKAEQMGSRVRSFFPEVEVYTRFISPRWLCHVGDFKTQDEAVAFLSDLRSKGGFGDAIVVKCKINSYTY